MEATSGRPRPPASSMSPCASGSWSGKPGRWTLDVVVRRAERIGVPAGDFLGAGQVAVSDGAREFAGGTARKTDQPVGVRRQQRAIHPRLVVEPVQTGP